MYSLFHFLFVLLLKTFISANIRSQCFSEYLAEFIWSKMLFLFGTKHDTIEVRMRCEQYVEPADVNATVCRLA